MTFDRLKDMFRGVSLDVENLFLLESFQRHYEVCFFAHE